MSAVNLMRPLIVDKFNKYVNFCNVCFSFWFLFQNNYSSVLTRTGFIYKLLFLDYSPNLISTIFKVLAFKQASQWEKIWAMHVFTVKQISCSVKHL